MSLRSSILTLLVVAVLAVPAVASAQSASVGIKAGANLAKIVNDDISNLKSSTGLTGGLFVTTPINETVDFQVEGLYSQKGAKITEGSTEVTVRLNYIDVPLLLKFSPKSGSSTRFNLFAGATASVKLSAKLKAGGVTEDLDEDVKGTDVGATVGIGLTANKLTLDARYTHGLMDIDNGASDKVKNKVFSVMIGWKLK